jgi:2-oxoglutarate ferredoxin oxidoreductase subunit delta
MNEEAFPQTKGQQAGSATPIVNQNNTNGPKTRGQKKAFRVEILKNQCKSCGICVAFCPLHCFKLDDTGRPLVAADKCSGCGWCELYCPDFAISVEGL